MGRLMSDYKGYLCALIATAVWSGNFIVARGLADTLEPISLAFLRWLVAFIVVLPFGIRGLSREWRIAMEHKGFMLVSSFLGITLFNTLIYIAARSTTAINLSLISITFPIFIIFFARILYKEAITPFKIVGMIIVISGVLLLLTGGDVGRLSGVEFDAGDLWMLAAAFVFALYSALIKKKPQGMGVLSFQLASFGLGLLLLLPFFLVEIAITPLPKLSLDTLGAIAYIGIFASFVAYLFWFKAIALVGPTTAGLIYYSLPIFSGILAYIFLGEEIGIPQLMAAVLIVGGVIVAGYKKKDKEF